MGFLSKLLGVISGNNGVKVSEQLLFDKVIGFRGVTPGCGTSTIVQNTAIALSEQTNYSICILDTAYMFPTQYPMLVTKNAPRDRDMLDFSGELADIVTITNHRNISLVSLSNRHIADMLSSADSDVTVDKVIGALKSYFDVILVDLTYEMTNINTYSAIKCNRIINVTDQSLKSVYYLRKSLNTLVSLAVPIAKANRIVINKVVPDVLSNTSKVAEEAGLKVIGEIPLSYEVAKLGVTGKRVYAQKSTNKEIFVFSSVIDSIVNELLQVTPLNEKYLDKDGVKTKSSTSVDTTQSEDIEFVTSTNVETLKQETKDSKRGSLFGRKTSPKPVPVKKEETDASTHFEEYEDDIEDDDEVIPNLFDNSGNK